MTNNPDATGAASIPGAERVCVSPPQGDARILRSSKKSGNIWYTDNTLRLGNIN